LLSFSDALSFAALALPRLVAAALLPGCAALLAGLSRILLLLLVLGLVGTALPTTRILRALSVLRAVLLI
jgi:hypothetical protein